MPHKLLKMRASVEQIQVFVLLSAFVIIFISSQVKKYEGVDHARKVWVMNCAFPDPIEYQIGPYPRAMEWCIDSDVKYLHHLMNFMVIHCAKMDGCIASEFGVPLAMGYMREAGLFLINPSIIPGTEHEKVDECKNSVGLDTVLKYRPVSVTVAFLDKQMRPVTMTFTGRESCLVQFEIEVMHSVV